MIEALEKEDKEDREKEAKMTPEEKAQWAEQRSRNWIAEWFEDRIKQNGEYSEALQIQQDGSLNPEERLDGRLPYVVDAADLKSPEDLYQLMHRISNEHPDLSISFEVDPGGKWIKYRVAKKVEIEK